MMWGLDLEEQVSEIPLPDSMCKMPRATAMQFLH